jgi:hypothetical protein
MNLSIVNSSFIVNNTSQAPESHSNINNNINNNISNNNNINSSNNSNIIDIIGNNNLNPSTQNRVPDNTINVSYVNNSNSNNYNNFINNNNNNNSISNSNSNNNDNNNNNNNTIMINNIEIINNNIKEQNNNFTHNLINDLINSNNHYPKNKINLNEINESEIKFSGQNSNEFEFYCKNNSLSSELLKLDSIISSSKNREFIPNLEKRNTIKSKKSKISINSKSSNYLRNKSKSKFIKESIISEDVELNLNSFNTYKSSFNINNTLISEVSNSILNEINKARKNPKEYSKKIQNFIPKILFDDSLKILYIAFKEFKYELKRGKPAFEECLNFLEFVDKNMKIVDYKLDPLIYLEELRFPFVLNDIDKLNDQNYIDECLEEIEVSLNEKYQIKAFQYFKCIFDLEVFSVLHVVDDNDHNKLIQKTIFNHRTKYIGINSVKLNENEGLYLLLLIYAI